MQAQPPSSPISFLTALLKVAETSTQRAGDGLLRTAAKIALTCSGGHMRVWGGANHQANGCIIKSETRLCMKATQCCN